MSRSPHRRFIVTSVVVCCPCWFVATGNVVEHLAGIDGQRAEIADESAAGFIGRSWSGVLPRL